MRRIVYGHNVQLPEAVARLGADGAQCIPRNVKYFGPDGREDCDEVHVLPGVPESVVSLIREVYEGHAIVCVADDSAPAPKAKETPKAPAKPEPPAPADNQGPSVDALVDALFTRARHKGYKKATLRKAIEERGVEAVASECGVDGDQLAALIAERS